MNPDALLCARAGLALPWRTCLGALIRLHPPHNNLVSTGFSFLLVLTFSMVFVPPHLIAQLRPKAGLPEDTLAVIGTSVVTAGDLLERLELMPWPMKDKPGRFDSAKVLALRSLIAEKLLALESARRGLAETGKTRVMREGLENLFVRDELFRREVLDKARPTEAEIREGMRRYGYELKLLLMGVRTREDAGMVIDELKNGLPPDSLSIVHGESLFLGRDTLTVRYGELMEDFENAAYSIGRSRLSEPIPSPHTGWLVLFVLESRPNFVAASLSTPDRRSKVESILLDRKSEALARAFYASTLKDRRAEADETAFHTLADTLLAMWHDLPDSVKTANTFGLTPDAVDVAQTRLRSHASGILIRLGDEALTLGHALELLRYRQFQSPTVEPEEFKNRLNAALKEVTAWEFLANEGRRRGLHRTHKVRHDLSVWTDYWAARELHYDILGRVEVGNEEIVGHLIKNAKHMGTRYEVNVREVLYATREDVQQGLEQLSAGRTLQELAFTSTVREDWKITGGESGYFSVDRYPELGVHALLAETGVLVGPARLPEGFSLFVVLGKRTIEPGATHPDSLAGMVRTRLTAEKRSTAVQRVIGGLAQEFDVRIDRAKVTALKVQPTQMFTRRMIGFGGTMMAVPMLIEEWGWVRELEQVASPLP